MCEGKRTKRAPDLPAVLSTLLTATTPRIEWHALPTFLRSGVRVTTPLLTPPAQLRAWLTLLYNVAAFFIPYIIPVFFLFATRFSSMGKFDANQAFQLCVIETEEENCFRLWESNLELYAKKREPRLRDPLNSESKRTRFFLGRVSPLNKRPLEQIAKPSHWK